LVFYTILDLRKLNLGINEYIKKLETICIEILQSNLKCTRKNGFPGLWIDERKIASIGVRVSKFITYHGMAINIQNDLSIFDFIKPCGLDNIEMTSLLKETNQITSMNLLKKRLTLLLKRHLS
jgi:lipoyl(octanoyl) transferase